MMSLGPSIAQIQKIVASTTEWPSAPVLIPMLRLLIWEFLLAVFFRLFESVVCVFGSHIYSQLILKHPLAFP
jgi:hypothetical protein